MNTHTYWKKHFSDPASKLLIKLFISTTISLFIAAPFMAMDNPLIVIPATLAFLVFPVRYSVKSINLMIKELKYYHSLNKLHHV